MRRKCWNQQMEEVWEIDGKSVCTVTHPDRPNHSGNSRGRKIHLVKDERKSICNMLIDEYCPSSNQNYSMVGNGYCGVCFRNIDTSKIRIKV